MKHIQTFEAGEDMPEWLMTITPKKRSSRKCTLRFAVKTHCLDFDNHILLVGDTLSAKPLIVASGGYAVKIEAAAKPFGIPVSLEIHKATSQEDQADTHLRS